MNWYPLLAVPLILAGCAPAEAPTAATTSWTYTPPAPTVDTTAQQARQQLDDLQASWLPYISDVTYSAGVLRVALQVDATTQRDQALDIGQAIITNMRVQPIKGVQWVEITDGAGTHITQADV
ncbi:hypothetical protein AB4Z39_10925 [Mycobacterium adipatum]|uniref:hypothetical protein n=1 Tax=Mycobacterium adipatum TaxID=1682113 RepID=UPI0034E06FA4